MDGVCIRTRYNQIRLPHLIFSPPQENQENQDNEDNLNDQDEQDDHEDKHDHDDNDDLITMIKIMKNENYEEDHIHVKTNK